jgi:hypothetical protein
VAGLCGHLKYRDSEVEKYPGISTVFVDTGYAGRYTQTINQQHGITLEVMHHERRVEVSKAWVWLAAGRQLLNRLTHTA